MKLLILTFSILFLTSCGMTQQEKLSKIEEYQAKDEKLLISLLSKI
jgi:hypothetical protein